MSKLAPMTLEEATRNARTILETIHGIWTRHIVEGLVAVRAWHKLELPAQKALELLGAASRRPVGQGDEELRAIARLLIRYQRHLDIELGRCEARAELPAPIAVEPRAAAPTPATTRQDGGCLGVDALVELHRLPTTLVTCPQCGRRNLGGVNVSRLDETARVPFHRAAKLGPTKIPQEARFGEHWESVSDAAKILDREYP